VKEYIREGEDEEEDVDIYRMKLRKWGILDT
jgi:hypothetical protein